MSLLTLPPSKLQQAVERTLIAGLVPYVQGSPGVGKSDIFRSLAVKWNLKLIDVRLSQCTPEDLNGLPMREGNRAIFAPFTTFPVEEDEIPEGYDGWLILLDELSSASKAVQAAAYKLLLDREVGVHKLHDRVKIAAAGNKATDKAVVISQSTALQSRLVHFEIEVSNSDWMKWAAQNEIDARIIGFIAYKPSYLHMFEPNHQNKTFPCPRTWAFVNKLIKDNNSLDQIDTACIAGAISDGPAIEFVKFAELATQLPPIEKILADPAKTEVPSQDSYRYFVTTALMTHVDAKNIEKAFTYMNRLPEEFQVVFVRGIANRDPKLRSNPVYAKNVTKLLRFIHEDKEDYYAATA